MSYQLYNIELKPGMVLITDNKEKYIVSSGYEGKLCLIRFGSTDWNYLPWDEVTDRVMLIKKSIGKTNLALGETIWHKSIELSMEEIAKKFHIPVEYIKIKQ